MAWTEDLADRSIEIAGLADSSGDRSQAPDWVSSWHKGHQLILFGEFVLTEEIGQLLFADRSKIQAILVFGDLLFQLFDLLRIVCHFQLVCFQLTIQLGHSSITLLWS